MASLQHDVTLAPSGSPTQNRSKQHGLRIDSVFPAGPRSPASWRKRGPRNPWDSSPTFPNNRGGDKDELTYTGTHTAPARVSTNLEAIRTEVECSAENSFIHAMGSGGGAGSGALGALEGTHLHDQPTTWVLAGREWGGAGCSEAGAAGWLRNVKHDSPLLPCAPHLPLRRSVMWSCQVDSSASPAPWLLALPLGRGQTAVLQLRTRAQAHSDTHPARAHTRAHARTHARPAASRFT